jgi:mRNA interferase MazF
MVKSESTGLPKDSVVLAEQIRTIDKKRVGNFMGSLCGSAMTDVDSAISVSFFGFAAAPT